MKKLFRILTLLFMVVLFSVTELFSQDSTSLYHKALYFPGRLLKNVDSKAAAINDRIVDQTEKYLKRIAREERRLQKRLARKDSAAAARIFGDVERMYSDLQNRARLDRVTTGSLSRRYIPDLDTLKTALQLFDETDGLLQQAPLDAPVLRRAIGSIDMLQKKFNDAEELKKFLSERRQFLTKELKKYGLSKQLLKLNKQVYYYQAQVEEYKSIIEDPSRLEARVVSMVQQTRLFRKFFQKHSQLAGLFQLPDNTAGNPMMRFAGLQTRDAVMHDLVQRFGSGPGVQQIMQQQTRGVQSPLNLLKDKIRSKGGDNGDMQLPDFKPNRQKTKRLKDRLELGVNLQTVKSNRFFPSTTDIGLSLGYKLNDRSVVGVGSAYKMGWGNSVRDIVISHQGVGARSFLDYKIKGSFWLSGGAELNYHSRFENLEVLKDYSAWQKSAMLGFSKKYRVSEKLKGNIQLMYDFLWKEQVPRAQAVVFRVGYKF